jgi:hypothetical protein
MLLLCSAIIDEDAIELAKFNLRKNKEIRISNLG